MAGTSTSSTGVRPGTSTSSTVMPGICWATAQSRSSVAARRMWPFASHAVSNMGDLAGTAMYSISVGSALSQAASM